MQRPDFAVDDWTLLDQVQRLDGVGQYLAWRWSDFWLLGHGRLPASPSWV